MDMDPRFTPRKGIPWLENPRPKPNFVDDRCAPQCDDQLPIFSRVGRGPKGDSVYAGIKDGWLIITDDDGNEQKCPIGAGTLTCTMQYDIEHTPQTFTMTFVYFEGENDPNNWTLTTPAIPFYGEAGEGTVTPHVQTVYVYDGNSNSPAWVEKLVYPAGYDDDPDHQHPAQGSAWTSNLILASTPTVTIDGNTYTTDIIVPKTSDILSHLHADLGWPTSGPDAVSYVGDGGSDTVKDLIEDMIGDALAPIYNIFADILDHIWGVTYTQDPVTGAITEVVWPEYNLGDDMKIPMADLNIFAGTVSPDNNTKADSIRSRTLSNNDIKAV